MKYLFIILLICFSSTVFSQVPQKMSYQAVIRDAQNNLLSLKDISMRISIVKGDLEPITIYTETQNGKTNLNGLASFQIGTGAILFGNFSKIDWANGPYYIFTETDPFGGFDYSIIGKSELLSVPYAMFAANSSSGFDTTNMYNKIISLQKQSIDNKNNIQNNLDSIIANALQIKLNVDNIQHNTDNIKNNLDTLNSKISTVDFNSLIAGYQKLGQFVSAISLEGIDSFDIKINGNLTASKTVTVGGNIEALGTTSTLGTLEKPFKGLFISSGSLSIASDTLGQNIPAAVLSNVRGSLEISAGGLKLVGTDQAIVAPRMISTLTGNASSATKFETPRTINGVAFDGSSNINIPSLNSNSISFNNVGTGDASGVAFDGSIAKTISYNSIGAAPLAGSTLITTVGNLTAGAIPFTLLTGTIPIWNQSTTGNAATVTTNANLTGIVTSIGNFTTINNAAITNAMLANAAVANLSGANSGDETNSSIMNKLGISVLIGDNSGDESTSTLKSKLGITTLSGSNTGDQVNISGNAGTATKLAASKTINGVAFDGSANIIIASASANALTYTNSGLGDVSGGTYDGSIAKIISYNTIGALASNTAITGATKTKLTYDAKGLVTAGADATTADIAASTNKNYVTDVQAGVISNTSGTNTGDESVATIKTKLGITTLSGDNTGDESTATIKTKLGITTLSGDNTGDESTATIKTKLGITSLSGSNTGDQVLPTLISLGAVANNSAITGATKTKLTYDAKGLVTAGADATTADIAASTNKNYVTDVQVGVISNTSGTNTGDESVATIKTKLGITTLSGDNTGDESTATIKTKLGITTLSGDNTGDESTATIKTKLGITTLSGDNTGDQVLPTLVSLGAVASNTAITGATKTKLTFDTKGLVTAGADATTADIAASTNKNYVTDVQAGVISNTSGTNTGDESTATIKTKLGITTLSGDNTGDESTATIKTKLGITTLSGSNTGDQVLPTLVSLGAVASNTAITGATKTKLTFDTKGLVTAGADATTADIAASANKNYVTDVQAGVISNTSGTNTGDESVATIKTKLGITTLSGDNTGDESTATIKTKLGITTLSGSNTGDQVLPTLVSLGAVASNTAITGATKTKLTYDAKGLVTAGADATTADIAASTNKNYVTDAQASVISNTSGTNTGDESSATIKTKLGITTLSGSNTGDQINITGNAATVTTNANLTGDITSSGNATTIGLLKVTNAMIAASTIDITSKVTGTLPIANGGTNTTATPTAGGINYGTGTAQAYTAVGTSGQYLQSAAGGSPVWAQPGPSSVTILTSLTPSSTYNVPADVKAILVELVGAGGGSGAIIASSGAGKGSVSGGGGSGSYNRILIVNPASSYVYTVGVGGIAGTAGGAGGTGGQTLFNGTTVTTFGGVGGNGCLTAVAAVVSKGGAGGAIGANGDFSVPGNAGGTGIVAGLVSLSGNGANSIFGGGGLASATLGTLILASTADATGYGAGASGIGIYATVVTSPNGTGAAGFQGVIIITEYK